VVVSAAEANAKGLRPIVNLLTDDGTGEAAIQRESVVLTCDRSITFQQNSKLTLADGDAMFLSLSAVDKFVVPYYARLRRLQEVTAMREEFASNPRAALMMHLPWSEPDIGVVGNK
jgi:hypothetical protein